MRRIATKKVKTRTKSRAVAARYLETWARRLRDGKPIRVGKRTAIPPARVMIETELEIRGNEAELELELKWSIPKPAKRRPSKQ